MNPFGGIMRGAVTMSALLFLFGSAPMVRAQSDTTPPNLTALGISPPSVDTTSGATTVTVSYSATDDISGVTCFGVGFKSASGSHRLEGGDCFAATTSGSGTAVVTVNQFAENGVYTIDRI